MKLQTVDETYQQCVRLRQVNIEISKIVYKIHTAQNFPLFRLHSLILQFIFTYRKNEADVGLTDKGYASIRLEKIKFVKTKKQKPTILQKRR